MTDILPVMNVSIECNNIAVSLLKAGLFSDALDTFKAAAQLMYPISQLFENPSTPNSVSPPNPNPTSDESTIVDLARSKLGLLAKTDSIAEGLSPSNCFVAAEPFLIDAVYAMPTSCTVESTIIVYNMGLTYHLLSCLDKAVCLFDMAFTLALSVEIYDSRSIKVAMASLNNAGQIHHSQGNYALSREYLDAMSKFILSLPSTSETGQMQRRHNFLLNAKMLREPTTAGAA